MVFKKLLLSVLLFMFSTMLYAQTITEVNYTVSNGATTSYDNPGTILYPTGYYKSSSKTPIIFVHGITGKLSGSYDANIDQVKNYNLRAAFIQLEPIGSTIENGKLLKKMIDKVRRHFNVATVSIVAHSKGGLDTERALYGQNPYVSYSLPSFGYEKVDAVYTFSSPVKGARVADLGATLSWFSGVVWATMWYTNGWSLTSGNVNSFHNWAKSWRVNSSSTFKNYYNPNGASYSRMNMKEDNTTRWWAHQSNDECYQDLWYYCYIGRPFHHSVGAYLDAYWEWDWFDSGWRNWHSDSDGFISEYRAKRDANTNPYPSLTPGSGDTNYRTMRDANHSSLWENGENHFSREVAPYLHNSLYSSSYYRGSSNQQQNVRNQKDEVKVQQSQLLGSSGNVYFGKNGTTKFIVEENNNKIEFIIYSSSKLNALTINNKNSKHVVKILESKKDNLSGAYVSVANINSLKAGVYDLSTVEDDFLVIANYPESSTAFAVNLNFNEKIGYNGENIEVGIANKNKAINFTQVQVKATLSKVAKNQNTLINIDKVANKEYIFKATSKKGIYSIAFNDLEKGSIYSLRIEAISEKGKVLLSRNIIHSFYVKKEIETTEVTVLNKKEKIKIGFNAINVYPNPVTSIVNISTSKNISEINLLNNQGESLKTFNVNATDFSINIKKMDLKEGLYMLKIQTGSTTITKKIMVQ